MTEQELNYSHYVLGRWREFMNMRDRRGALVLRRRGDDADDAIEVSEDEARAVFTVLLAPLRDHLQRMGVELPEPSDA